MTTLGDLNRVDAEVKALNRRGNELAGLIKYLNTSVKNSSAGCATPIVLSTHNTELTELFKKLFQDTDVISNMLEIMKSHLEAELAGVTLKSLMLERKISSSIVQSNTE